jgi:3-isopropylmalate/(R)-2-methylmalate dehydratase small subunit
VHRPHANCFKNAVLPVTLPAADVRAVMDAARDREQITVDVATATISIGDRTIASDLADLRRTALLDGLDDLDVALRLHEEIARFERTDRTRRPWVHAPPGFL